MSCIHYSDHLCFYALLLILCPTAGNIIFHNMGIILSPALANILSTTHLWPGKAAVLGRNGNAKTAIWLFSYLDKRCHAHSHSHILCMRGVGDITLLLIVIIALLLLLSLILRTVGCVALLIIGVVTLLLQYDHSNSV